MDEYLLNMIFFLLFFSVLNTKDFGIPYQRLSSAGKVRLEGRVVERRSVHRSHLEPESERGEREGDSCFRASLAAAERSGASAEANGAKNIKKIKKYLGGSRR